MAKGRTNLDYEKCKVFSLCISFCPTKILFLDKTQINTKGYYLIKVSEPDKCFACGFCAIMCYDLAGAELPAVIINVMLSGPGIGGIQPSQTDYFQITREVEMGIIA